MRRVLQFLLAATLAGSGVCSAQIIPWSEPPVLADGEKFPTRPRASRRAEKISPEEIPLRAPPAAPDVSLLGLIMGSLLSPASLTLSSFDSSAGSGSVRANTSWVGQVTQNASSITVAGIAGDDNGWGATGLSLDASSMTFLAITAQRDAGNLAPSVFIQIEDRTLRTKVYSVSTSLFAFGTPTTVHVPLAGWTIDFGASDIFGWSIGGGNVGDVAFRLTFSDVGFTTSAIPEPSTYAALLGLSACLAVAWRRRALGLVADRRRASARR